MPNLLYCVGHALVKNAGGIPAAVVDVTGVAAAALAGNVAADGWKEWRAGKKQDQLHADILEVTKLEFAEVKAIAAEVARQVAPGDSELAGHVERFVTLIPASVRASLRRPEDETGTTLPAGYALHDAEDLVKLLPVRLPRFKAGDTPTFLRGWELLEQIGAGGFGEVWKARNRRVSNLIDAVKFGHALSDAEYALLNEGDVIGRLMADGGHPGVVALRDAWGEGDGVPWLRYEYVPGGDLTGLIHRWQTLPAADRLTAALGKLRELAGTVGHFHRLPGGPLVHRDLKPSNILVAADGKLKIADFGIGAVSARRALDGERAGTASRAGRLQSYLRGSHTPLYASPQQRSGSRDLDPRDDVHALGVIAYQMLTGRLDQGAGPDFADDLREFGAAEGVVTLLARCVAAKAERRPKDAGELADGLAAFVEGGEGARMPAVPTAKAIAVARVVATVTPRPAETKRRFTPMPKLAPGLELPGATLVELRTLVGHRDGVNSVAFSPDRRVLATASSDGTIRLWEAETGRGIHVLAGHVSAVLDVAFSPDGATVATAGLDYTVRTWAVATGDEVYCLHGHTGWVNGLAFSPDGETIATAGQDCVVRLWNAETGKNFSTLADHDAPVSGLTFGSNNDLLATACWDGSSRL